MPRTHLDSFPLLFLLPINVNNHISDQDEYRERGGGVRRNTGGAEKRGRKKLGKSCFIGRRCGLSVGYAENSSRFLSIAFPPLNPPINVNNHISDQVYIIYMGKLPKGDYLARSHHINLLQSIGHTNNMAENKLLRSYTRSFNGFAAYLTIKEASKLRDLTFVVSVFQSHKFQLLTTRSWDYMGLSLKIHRNPTAESDIIIGHIDTGILPDMESLSDHGFSDVPKKWRGVCLGGKNFTCNKKLIGARYYVGDSVIDTLSHGTHTASIAVGRIVKNASYFGIANGTARGGVPSSRIASYKVCGDVSGCDDKDILAAFDDAIGDNVDIINFSIGHGKLLNISEDSHAIGSFHAMEKGILTVQSAGNSGGFVTSTSTAPWLFTVASSNTDRKIFNKLILGNGRTFNSMAVNPLSSGNDNKMLVYGRGITNHCNESSAMQCLLECIDPHLVKEKIMLCNVDESMSSVTIFAMNSNASGVILQKSVKYKDLPEPTNFPAAFLNDLDYQNVESYLKSTTFPSARISKSETIRSDYPPIVASDSSRGPNAIFPEIFKPDISAPGIAILAESPEAEESGFQSFSTKYNIKSGTSIACPHVVGAAAYVKSKHPDWSVSAIKSSLMTTAWPMSTKYNVDAELGYGAGHVDPVKAEHPGLVYETFIDEYINMLCSLGSEGDKLIKMLRESKNCTKGIRISPKDLNYPAMTAPVHTNSHFTIKFTRIVTNVGFVNSTYHAQISTRDKTIKVIVKPNIISFVNLNERKKFSVIVSGQWFNQDHISSSLIWFDGTHKVRSPIFLYRSSLI